MFVFLSSGQDDGRYERNDSSSMKYYRNYEKVCMYRMRICL